MIELKINLCNNLTLTFIKLEDFDRALISGQIAMETDSSNVKTIFRIG